MAFLHPRRSPRWRLLPAAAVSAALWPPAVAHASDAAPSAQASSLTMPAFLLDSTWQVHLHPQLAATAPSQLAASAANSSGSPAGIQIILRQGGTAFFAASQSNQPLSTVPISSDPVQIGMAVGLGDVRVGAAVRGAIARNDNRDFVFVPNSTSSNTQDDVEEHSADRIEGAFGVGFGGERAFLDLTFEATRERFETAVWDTSSQGVYEVDVDGAPVVRYGGAVRIGVPGPWQTRLQVAGSFNDRTADVTVVQSQPDSLRRTARRDEYGHLWRAGLTISRDVSRASLSFFALYVNQDGPAEYQRLFSSYREYHRTRDSDVVQFGMSLDRDFWWDTRLLLGVQSNFQLIRDREYRERNDGRLDYDTRTTETISRSFGWGLQRSFDNIDLTGAMRTDLAAGDLFVFLDAVYRL